MAGESSYEVYAVKYAHLAARERRENFIETPDPHDGHMPLDYFVWAILNEERTIVVDTGFGHPEAARRGRHLLRLPREGLALLDIDAATVEDVIVTHLHYDHAGTLDHFPRARFHVQDLEMAYATGRHMGEAFFRTAYSATDVSQMVQRVFEERVQFHDGDDEIAPGVTVHHIGGHTMGLQCVRVITRRGPIVLASDASHFYENIESRAPFPIVYDVGGMIEGYDRLRNLAGARGDIVPGHDPLVMGRYPAARTELDGIVVRLDADLT